jgi:polysaccharide chain length determinant protein (PEP-CTERM system associated)
VNTDTVLKPLLKGLTATAEPNTQVSQVTMMTRALLSRPNLETVIAKTGLGAKASTLAARDRLLERLQVEILVTKVEREPLYDISFSDSDRATAQAVVQALVDDFMAGSQSGDTEQSAEAEAFIQEQIKIYEQRLTTAERRLADFKRKNMGLMQGGGVAESDYYTRVQAAQSAADSLQSQIRSLAGRRNELLRQLAGEESGGGTRGPGVRDSTSVDAAIGKLEAEVADLRLRFTERHPDVARVQQTLEDLYRIREEELRARAAGGASPRPTLDNLVYQQMKIALSTAEADLAGLQSQLAEKIAQVNYLRGMANTIPEVEAELVRLNRDYGVIKKEYEALLQGLESVTMKQEVQEDNKDIQFRVVDPPHTPLAPAGPDRFRLNTMVIIAALGFGFGIAFLLSHRDPTFYSAASLRGVAGLPVYGLVGIAGATATEQHSWRFGIASGALLLAYALVLAFGGIHS